MFLSGVRHLVAQMSLKGKITENTEIENAPIHSFQMMSELLGDTHLEAKFYYGPFPSSLPLNIFEFKLVQLQDRCCAIGRYNRLLFTAARRVKNMAPTWSHTSPHPGLQAKSK